METPMKSPFSNIAIDRHPQPTVHTIYKTFEIVHGNWTWTDVDGCGNKGGS